MSHSRVEFIARILILILIVMAGFGSAVLHLWNWLMPDLFGLKQINYWQALGLMGLCWILFRAGFMGGHHRAFSPSSRHQPDSSLTQDQREKLRAALDCDAAPRHGSNPTQSVP